VGKIGFASFFVDSNAMMMVGGSCKLRGWFFAGLRAAFGC
jgi:hypothetical protein